MKKVIKGLMLVLVTSLQASVNVGDLNFSSLQNTQKFLVVEESKSVVLKGMEIHFLPNKTHLGILWGNTPNGVLPMKMVYSTGNIIPGYPEMNDGKKKIVIDVEVDKTFFLSGMKKVKGKQECYITNILALSRSQGVGKDVGSAKVCIHKSR